MLAQSLRTRTHSNPIIFQYTPNPFVLLLLLRLFLLLLLLFLLLLLLLLLLLPLPPSPTALRTSGSQYKCWTIIGLCPLKLGCRSLQETNTAL